MVSDLCDRENRIVLQFITLKLDHVAHEFESILLSTQHGHYPCYALTVQRLIHHYETILESLDYLQAYHWSYYDIYHSDWSDQDFTDYLIMTNEWIEIRLKLSRSMVEEVARLVVEWITQMPIVSYPQLI